MIRRYRLGFVILLISLFIACSGSNSNDNGKSDIISDFGVQDIIQDENTKQDQNQNTTDTAQDKQTNQEVTTDIPVDETTGGDTTVEAFKVVSTSPKPGEEGVKMPFKITIVFNRPVRMQSVQDSTFYVLDPQGKRITKGLYKISNPEPTKLVYELMPTYHCIPASPYTVVLDRNIVDDIGIRLEDGYTFTFYTAPPEGSQKKYYDIAVKYAPIIYQATDPSEPRKDYITRIDFDGDWDASNNWQNLLKTKGIPADVYYEVIETESHYFIIYGYLHLLSDYGNAKTHGNDMSGALIVVAKYPQEHPVAVEAYFHPAGSTDELLSYATTESGFVPTGKNPSKYSFDGLIDQNTLFIKGHYQAYISEKKHESCLWVVQNNAGIGSIYCKLTANDKKTKKFIKYEYVDGKEQKIVQKGNNFPAEEKDVSYALRWVLTDLWAHRNKIGNNGLFKEDFTYWKGIHDPDNLENRPGAGLQFPLRFVDSYKEGFSSVKGKPPWSWGWNTTLPTYQYVTQVPFGSVLLDPAYYFGKRHRVPYKKDAKFDPQTKKGYSVKYCFNPYLGIDNRGKTQGVYCPEPK